jgi:hypothetical protein
LQEKEYALKERMQKEFENAKTAIWEGMTPEEQSEMSHLKNLPYDQFAKEFSELKEKKEKERNLQIDVELKLSERMREEEDRITGRIQALEDRELDLKEDIAKEERGILIKQKEADIQERKEINVARIKANEKLTGKTDEKTIEERFGDDIRAHLKVAFGISDFYAKLADPKARHKYLSAYTYTIDIMKNPAAFGKKEGITMGEAVEMAVDKVGGLKSLFDKEKPPTEENAN